LKERKKAQDTKLNQGAINGKNQRYEYGLDIEKNLVGQPPVCVPPMFKDGKLDIDMLLNLCGEYIDEDFEKYKFEWKGKAECFRIAGKRSTGTLRPCPEESVNFDPKTSTSKAIT